MHLRESLEVLNLLLLMTLIFQMLPFLLAKYYQKLNELVSHLTHFFLLLFPFSKKFRIILSFFRSFIYFILLYLLLIFILSFFIFSRLSPHPSINEFYLLYHDLYSQQYSEHQILSSDLELLSFKQILRNFQICSIIHSFYQ